MMNEVDVLKSVSIALTSTLSQAPEIFVQSYVTEAIVIMFSLKVSEGRDKLIFCLAGTHVRFR